MWTWIGVAVAVALLISVVFILVLKLLSRRTDAKSSVRFVPDCVLLVTSPYAGAPRGDVATDGCLSG